MKSAKRVLALVAMFAVSGVVEARKKEEPKAAWSDYLSPSKNVEKLEKAVSANPKTALLVAAVLAVAVEHSVKYAAEVLNNDQNADESDLDIA
ncbi:MAG: hypothetical protein CL947_03090 [Epsilonproteobacteria bacterium]|nr:hypothetical protein [Campylobacterota bacterium]|tara:strand:- start:2834 stop:3112 length:279 start_codon:yes stop_codon:yes gene_type:complete